MDNLKTQFRDALGFLILGAVQAGLSETEIEDVILNNVLDAHEIKDETGKQQILDLPFIDVPVDDNTGNAMTG